MKKGRLLGSNQQSLVFTLSTLVATFYWMGVEAPPINGRDTTTRQAVDQNRANICDALRQRLIDIFLRHPRYRMPQPATVTGSLLGMDVGRTQLSKAASSWSLAAKRSPCPPSPHTLALLANTSSSGSGDSGGSDNAAAAGPPPLDQHSSDAGWHRPTSAPRNKLQTCP